MSIARKVEKVLTSNKMHLKSKRILFHIIQIKFTLFDTHFGLQIVKNDLKNSAKN